MAVYPALFEPREEGGYVVEFPDLPGCFTQGRDEQEAVSMAADALEGHILALHDLGRDVPPPSLPSAVPVPAGAFLALISASEAEGEPVRINVSIDRGLLSRIDRTAKREGMTRSGLLAVAARQFMARL